MIPKAWNIFASLVLHFSIKGPLIPGMEIIRAAVIVEKTDGLQSHLPTSSGSQLSNIHCSLRPEGCSPVEVKISFDPSIIRI